MNILKNNPLEDIVCFVVLFLVYMINLDFSFRVAVIILIALLVLCSMYVLYMALATRPSAIDR